MAHRVSISGTYIGGSCKLPKRDWQRLRKSVANITSGGTVLNPDFKEFIVSCNAKDARDPTVLFAGVVNCEIPVRSAQSAGTVTPS